MNGGDSKILLVIKQEVRFFQRHSRLFLGFVSLMNGWPEAIRECTIVILQGSTSRLSELCMPMQYDLDFEIIWQKDNNYSTRHTFRVQQIGTGT